jgi:hypothetical protein
LSLLGVVSPSLLNHGVGLVCVGGYARAPIKSHESEVYDSGGARGLPRARGSHVPCFEGGIGRGIHNVLRAGIWCAITSISLLFVVVLWLGTSSLDPLEDLTYGSLIDPVRGLYDD